jgi:2',3'-cyclic-nucleotide 2'-phosphodiesterase (5'-nucleotidase family)
MAIQLNPLGRFTTGIFDEGAAEIVAHDPNSQRLFVVNSNSATVDILDIADPSNPTRTAAIDVSAFGAGVNSVDVYEGIVATAVENQDPQAPGSVVFFDTDGNVLNSVTVGSLPDMVTFTPDGNKVLVANEGEPSDDYTNDPEGSVSIIDVSNGVDNLTQGNVATASFAPFNGKAEALRNRGVRIFGPNASVAQDLEPEYIAPTADSSRAYISLQENNAMAVVDLNTATVLDVLPFGVKEHLRGDTLLSQFDVTNLPPLGTTADGETFQLGGLSGLSFSGVNPETGNFQFWTVPDRGPDAGTQDVDGDGEEERLFLLPDYQPRVVQLELNPSSGQVNVVGQIPLTKSDGNTPITGLPNLPGVDEQPFQQVGDSFQELPFDPLGADLEGIVRGPGGDFWMVDEYRPSIYQFGPDGVLKNRFVPEGTDPNGQGTFGSETLPEVYGSRRANRGFEAVSFDSDDGILYAFIQTPLENPNREASDNSQVIRMLGIDPATGEPVAEHVYLLEKPEFSEGNVDKIGDAVYAGDGKFFVVERDSGTNFTSRKPIYQIDTEGATNLLTDPISPIPGLTLEQHTPDQLQQAGIQPVSKTEVLNLPSAGYLPSDKPEGLAIVPDGADASTLAILNDNDFAQNPDTAAIRMGILNSKFLEGNQLDASNEDGEINLQNHPIFGMYQPDAIDTFEVNGETFVIGANEGDARDYDTFSEETSVADLNLDPEAFPNAETLQQPENLGALTVTNANGDVDGDGDYDQIFSFGGRSFAIWDEYGNLIFDSSDDLARITASSFPDFFNSDNDENTFDSRSDDKGAEPEALTTGVIGDRTYAFVGLERIGGIVVYDITNPAVPEPIQYINPRDFSGDPEAGTAGDLGPEGMKFIAADESPIDKPLLAVGNEVSGSTTVYEINPAPAASLQILHASDLEGGVDAIEDAPNFAAVVEGLEADAASKGIPSITVSAGDNYIPGPFFSAAGDDSLESTFQNLLGNPNAEPAPGRADITAMNIIGFDASAFGNHEFDNSTSAVEDIITADVEDSDEDGTLDTAAWLGADFPYLSANLNFSNDGLSGVTSDLILPSTEFNSPLSNLEAAAAAPKIAPATIIERGGHQFGVVGATTPLVESISSPGDVDVKGAESNNMAALAAVLQPTINQLEDQGVNKIITVTHLQQFQLEEQLMPLLQGVDIAIAGGSDTISADESDRLRSGDEADVPYPVITQNADGEPVAIVSTDGEYSYVGRLVADFDANGVLIPESITPEESGAFATDTQGVTDVWNSVAPGQDPFAPGTKGAQVRTLTDAVEGVVTAKDQQVFGETTVFLDGRRSQVRTEETNLGNLTADANLFVAQQADPAVQISLKNGGGIRAPIGEVIGDAGQTVPPQANPVSGKEEGEISQLDIENSLRFNNDLSLLTVTAEELKQVIENGVSETAPGVTPGRFPQVSGMVFSFDPSQPAGSRVQSLAVLNPDGTVSDAVVQNGEVVGDPSRTFRMVTLGFLADGGDSYPFPDFANTDRVDLETAEQEALAQYLQEIGTFTNAETAPAEDTRIQNLSVRGDTIFDAGFVARSGEDVDLALPDLVGDDATAEDLNAVGSSEDFSDPIVDMSSNSELQVMASRFESIFGAPATSVSGSDLDPLAADGSSATLLDSDLNEAGALL